MGKPVFYFPDSTLDDARVIKLSDVEEIITQLELKLAIKDDVINAQKLVIKTYELRKCETCEHKETRNCYSYVVHEGKRKDENYLISVKLNYCSAHTPKQ